MLVEPIQKSVQSAHVVVLASEKGGSGKSTTALHIAIACSRLAGASLLSISTAAKKLSPVTSRTAAPGLRTRIHQVCFARAGQGGILCSDPFLCPYMIFCFNTV